MFGSVTFVRRPAEASAHCTRLCAAARPCTYSRVRGMIADCPQLRDPPTAARAVPDAPPRAHSAAPTPAARRYISGAKSAARLPKKQDRRPSSCHARSMTRSLPGSAPACPPPTARIPWFSASVCVCRRHRCSAVAHTTTLGFVGARTAKSDGSVLLIALMTSSASCSSFDLASADWVKLG